MIINYYYHHCHSLFVQGSNREVRGWERKKIKEKKESQSLGGSLGSYRGDTVLLEVG